MSPGLLGEQLDVATRRQLRLAGISTATLRAQLAGGRWRALNDRVVVCHNGPLTWRQSLWAAVLSAEPPVALCSLTALQEAGLLGFESDEIHLLVPRGARLLRPVGVPVVVHESRRFTARDVRRSLDPPRTPVERAAIDAAAWSRSQLTSARLLTAMVQQRLTVPSRLMAALVEAGKVRHHRLIGQLLADIDGGATALSELELLRWCRRHRLPQPTMQVRTDIQGRRRYLDARFRGRGGRTVLVEVDGGVHLTLTERWRDAAKDNDATLAGRMVLRFPSVALYTNDPAAVAQLRRALGLPGG